ncbi:hypothetical protein CAEBREN_08203 [Caenorhabditis brenneri]|uniref:C3H1-type domain-containing protein n=1 Tax=Caenorhabditis brenneri TaxID=135651 RepID=G0MDS5_CAEBE|nr:hypothetical protein CAEBREN_08203 [Caenorhabditis brenneri]
MAEPPVKVKQHSFVVEEKPSHLRFLNEFRVNGCELFRQHGCQQHRPYTCFYWHFANQRRRRPAVLPNGSFNYSPDIYCDDYDENSGHCPNGDSCPFLHRVSGDVERKYHLRYFKTAQCTHTNDARGQCVKNGSICAFAHSPTDIRAPVVCVDFGKRPSKRVFQFDTPDERFLNMSDREKQNRASFIVDDVRWHGEWRVVRWNLFLAFPEADSVLSRYKTEVCQKPARLCRQGYACPSYHNSKDRRRPPSQYNYRTAPCPAARSYEEWLDPDLCEAGDDCQFCHTRTEQQFHPEIYKSTKCSDILENGYCPRGVFCAFAHHEEELHAPRNPFGQGAKDNGGLSTSQLEITQFEPPVHLEMPPGLETALVLGSCDVRKQLPNGGGDQRLRAQSINMGQLESMKRNMFVSGRLQDSGNPSHSSLCSDVGLRMEPLDELNFHLLSIDGNQFGSLQEKCQYLFEAVKDANERGEMWKMRCHGEFLEKNRLAAENRMLYEQVEHLKQFLPQTSPVPPQMPIGISMPPQDNFGGAIRPSASLPHSPSYNIFEASQNEGFDTGACARCGRDRTARSSYEENTCPACSN